MDRKVVESYNRIAILTTLRTSIIPRVITSFAAVSHVLPPVLFSLHTSFVCSQSISTLINLIEKSMNFHNVRSKKEQREYKEFEQLFSVSVHCNQTHRPGNS